MTREPNELPPASSTNPTGEDIAKAVVNRVQELTWALLDEQATDDDLALLDTLLLGDDKARRTYIGCVQLHTDLLHHFAATANQAKPTPGAKSPVLGFLNAGLPPWGLESPPVEDVKSS